MVLIQVPGETEGGKNKQNREAGGGGRERITGISAGTHKRKRLLYAANEELL